MVWSVTYRGSDGKQKSLDIEAGSRSEVFDELMNRGITAIRIAESEPNTGRSRVRPLTPKRTHAYVIVAGLLAAIFVVCIFFAPHGTEKPAQETTERPTKRITTETRTTVAPAPSRRPEVNQPKNDEATERKRRQEMFSRMTPDEKLDYLYERAKATPLPSEPSSNRIFRTSTEQVMDWIFTCEVGSPPPLLPPMSIFDQAHLAEILISDNPIREDDSDRAKEAKSTMKLAKAEFIKFIREGGNPDDFLPYYHGQLVHAHDQWKEARNAIVEMVKTQPDIAFEFANRVNEELQGKGIKTVTIPPKMLEAFGIQPEE